MSAQRPSDVLGALPRTRPHRRSQKRGARPAPAAAATPAPAPPTTARRAPAPVERRAASSGPAQPRSQNPPKTAKPRSAAGAPAVKPRPERLRQPAQPEGTPQVPRQRRPSPASSADVVGTAVQAAAELAEIGLSIGARALRSAVSRLPRP